MRPGAYPHRHCARRGGGLCRAGDRGEGARGQGRGSTSRRRAGRGHGAVHRPVGALPGVYGTHHIGASTDQAQEAIAAETVRIVRSYQATGRVPNVVNLATSARRPPHARREPPRSAWRAGACVQRSCGRAESTYRKRKTSFSPGPRRRWRASISTARRRRISAGRSNPRTPKRAGLAARDTVKNNPQEPGDPAPRSDRCSRESAGGRPPLLSIS